MDHEFGTPCLTIGCGGTPDRPAATTVNTAMPESTAVSIPQAR